MNESSIRYNVNAKWMRLLATMELKEKTSFLKKVKDGACRQISAYTYGENYQFYLEIQIRIAFGPSGGWKNDQRQIQCF